PTRRRSSSLSVIQPPPPPNDVVFAICPGRPSRDYLRRGGAIAYGLDSIIAIELLLVMSDGARERLDPPPGRLAALSSMPGVPISRHACSSVNAKWTPRHAIGCLPTSRIRFLAPGTAGYGTTVRTTGASCGRRVRSVDQSGIASYGSHSFISG